MASVGAEQDRALDRGRDGATDKAVEPVVVGMAGAEFPFIDGPASTFGLDPVLGCDVIGEEVVIMFSKQRQTALVAHGYREAGVDHTTFSGPDQENPRCEDGTPHRLSS